MKKLRRPHICKLNYLPLYTPYEKIVNEIFESFHIYKSEDIKYNQAIKDVLNQAILQIIKLPDSLIKLEKNSDTKYAQIKMKGEAFALDVENITFYIGINAEFDNEESDAINISVNDIDLSDYNKVKPVLYKQNEYVTIIVTTGGALISPFKRLQFLDDISHELIHVFHSLKKEELNIKAGNDYTYAEQLINQIDKTKMFPSAIYFQKIQNILLPLKELIRIYAACIYYLGTSEYSAWLDTYAKELNRITHYEGGTNNDNKFKTRPYIIYSTINKTLKQYTDDFINLHKMCNDSIQLIFYNYFAQYRKNKNYDISKLNTKNLIKFWINRTESFIKKCDLIADKLDKNKKD